MALTQEQIDNLKPGDSLTIDSVLVEYLGPEGHDESHLEINSDPPELSFRWPNGFCDSAFPNLFSLPESDEDRAKRLADIANRRTGRAIARACTHVNDEVVELADKLSAAEYRFSIFTLDEFARLLGVDE